MKNFFPLLLSCAFLAGCASGTPYSADSLTPPPAGDAQLIVYYPYKGSFLTKSMAMKTSLTINHHACPIFINGAVIVNEPAGEAVIEYPRSLIAVMSDAHQDLSFKTIAGQRYFVRIAEKSSAQVMQSDSLLLQGMKVVANSENDSLRFPYEFQQVDAGLAAQELPETQTVECKPGE